MVRDNSRFGHAANHPLSVTISSQSVERRLFNILSALSLLLFLATAAYLVLLLLASNFLPVFRNVWNVPNAWLLPLCLLPLTAIMPVLWLNARKKGRVVNILPALSLLLCLAAGILWVRSYWVDEYVQVAWQAPQKHSGYTGFRMDSEGGLLTLKCGDDLGYFAFLDIGFHYGGVTRGNRWNTVTGWRFGYSRGQDNIMIQAPYWAVVLSTVVLPLLWLNSHLEIRRRLKLGLCLTCGYDMRATPDRCPECGTQVVARGPSVNRRRLAIVASLPLLVCLAAVVWWARRGSVEDWRHGNGICAVHHLQMNTVQIHACRALIDYVPGYGDAREKLFPNAGIDYGPDLYSDRVGLIYVCPDCEAARSHWHQ